MRPHDLDPATLHTLLVVARVGTFDAAAAALFVTPSAVSQRIKALESKVGQVLITRTKPAEPTDAGRVLVRLASQWEVLGREAMSELVTEENDDDPVSMALVANADSLATWLLPALARVQRSRNVVFELLREDERHSADLLRHGTVLGAVTSDPTPVQGCRVVELGAMRYLPVASPDFVRRWLSGGFESVGLAKAPIISFDRKDTLQSEVLGAACGPGVMPPAVFVPASRDFDDAVRLGMGWGMLPEAWIQDSLASGALVSLSESHARSINLYRQHWALASPLVKAVTDAVVSQGRESLSHGGRLRE